MDLPVKLKRLDLVSFVADGSILPRETGVSDRPMKTEAAETEETESE